MRGKYIKVISLFDPLVPWLFEPTLYDKGGPYKWALADFVLDDDLDNPIEIIKDCYHKDIKPLTVPNKIKEFYKLVFILYLVVRLRIFRRFYMKKYPELFI